MNFKTLLTTGDTACFGIRNELTLATLLLLSRSSTLRFGHALSFSQRQAPVWVLLILARAALALDAAINTDAHPLLIAPLLELAHFFLALGFIVLAFTLAVHGLPYPLLAIIGVITILARSHVGIRAGVLVKRALRPSDTRRANLVAFLSASSH